MTEQARKIRHKAMPEWAEGLYYNSGMFHEVLVYHDDEAIYFEHLGKDDGHALDGPQHHRRGGRGVGLGDVLWPFASPGW
jgi:hypothetical protein